jgi:hypothetical protein
MALSAPGPRGSRKRRWVNCLTFDPANPWEFRAKAMVTCLECRSTEAPMFREQMISFLQATVVVPLLTNAARLQRDTAGKWPLKTPKAEVIYLMEHETFDDVARRRCR